MPPPDPHRLINTSKPDFSRANRFHAFQEEGCREALAADLIGDVSVDAKGNVIWSLRALAR
jgi:hypothetical protein